MGTREIELCFGAGSVYRCVLPEYQVLHYQRAPRALEPLEGVVTAALQSPLEFPPLSQAVVPGDRVVVALDRSTPGAATLVRCVWDCLAARGVSPEDVLVIHPATVDASPCPDPRGLLPAGARREVRWACHDAEAPGACTYLASTAVNERIYLARELVDADVVVSVGAMAYDPVLGYRGTHSVLYPGLSSQEAIRRAHGLGHDELGPDDARGLRQTIDEVGWLLGVQFTLQVIPAGQGGVADVLAGASDAVLRKGKTLLRRRWHVRLPERPRTVVLAVDATAYASPWWSLGAALDVGRRIVARHGRILVLTDLSTAPVGGGWNLLRDSRTPRDAFQPLRAAAPDDLIPATSLAKAVDWANVHLLSRLPTELVEELFMAPLGETEDVDRLLDQDERCVLLESAQYVHPEVVADR
jgi:nickel-dependent lactate racemase